jgi:hypothetical protein
MIIFGFQNYHFTATGCPIKMTQELMALKKFSRRRQEITSTSTMEMMPLFRRWPLSLIKHWPLPLPLIQQQLLVGLLKTDLSIALLIKLVPIVD